MRAEGAGGDAGGEGVWGFLKGSSTTPSRTPLPWMMRRLIYASLGRLTTHATLKSPRLHDLRFSLLPLLEMMAEFLRCLGMCAAPPFPSFFYIYNFSALVIFLTPLFPACYCCFPVSVPLGIKEKLYSLISRNEEERNREQETERRSLKPLTRVLGDEGGKIKVLWLQYVAGWSICQHMRPRRRRAGKGRSRGEEKGDLDAI